MTELEYMDQYYQMNPETEDIVLSGNYLRKGLVVLVENSGYRLDPSRKNSLSKGEMELLRMRNCWAEIVSEIESYSDGQVGFLAKYSDGIVKKVVVANTFAWLIKKASISYSSDDLLRLKGMWEGIRNTLNSILGKQKNLIRNHGDYTDERRDAIIEHGLYEIFQNVERTINSLDEKDISKTYETLHRGQSEKTMQIVDPKEYASVDLEETRKLLDHSGCFDNGRVCKMGSGEFSKTKNMNRRGDPLIFDTPQIADNILNGLKVLLQQKGRVSVGQLNNLLGREDSRIDFGFGWDDLSDAKIEAHGAKGYILILPPTKTFTEIAVDKVMKDVKGILNEAGIENE
jgi:hypothetical protein